MNGLEDTADLAEILRTLRTLTQQEVDERGRLKDRDDLTPQERLGYTPSPRESRENLPIFEF